MKTTNMLMIAAAALALGGFSAHATAQGKGQEKSRGKAATAQESKGQAQAKGAPQQAQPQAKGRGAESAPGRQAQPAAQGRATPPGQARADARASRAAGAPSRQRAVFTRPLTINDVPASVRPFLNSNRRPQVVAAGAVARAHNRGIDNELRIVPAGDGVTLANRRGTVLVALDDRGARELGAWNVNVFDAPPANTAPAFCRSGAGHPVWGRQWCVDKGFGLGTFQDVRWGRTTTVGDVIFGRSVQTGRLTTESLLGLLGATAFNRLALHAVTLGYTEPLIGTWAADPTEPNVLLVNAGPAPVAEFVDANRDGRPDFMLVALRPW
jgi:hypothetical protein